MTLADSIEIILDNLSVAILLGKLEKIFVLKKMENVMKKDVVLIMLRKLITFLIVTLTTYQKTLILMI